MNDYFTDRETLSQFVDELIKKKALAVDNVEELNKIREESIKALDDEIGEAIFGNLTDEQCKELNHLLDHDETANYEEYFAKNNINVAKIIAETMQNFATKFLGGQNE